MLDNLVGHSVLVMCEKYHYHGTLVAVDEKYLQLEDVYIVIETGLKKAGDTYEDAYKFHKPHDRSEASPTPNGAIIVRSKVESVHEAFQTPEE